MAAAFMFQKPIERFSSHARTTSTSPTTASRVPRSEASTSERSDGSRRNAPARTAPAAISRPTVTIAPSTPPYESRSSKSKTISTTRRSARTVATAPAANSIVSSGIGDGLAPAEDCVLMKATTAAAPAAITTRPTSVPESSQALTIAPRRARRIRAIEPPKINCPAGPNLDHIAATWALETLGSGDGVDAAACVGSVEPSAGGVGSVSSVIDRSLSMPAARSGGERRLGVGHGTATPPSAEASRAPWAGRIA